jgi:C-terminal processing protease CtpA/Prc
MNRNRRLAWLSVFGLLAVCGAIGTRAAMAMAARRYLNAALDIMEKHSVTRREVDWPGLRAQARQRASAALTSSQTYDAIRFALSSLGDHHSGLIEPESVAQLSALTAADNPGPRGRILSGRIGYILVPSVVGTSQASIDASATRLQRIVKDIGGEPPCGWMIDLQNNIGGNMWPMLAGLGPILGSGTLGGTQDLDDVQVRWSYEDGAALEGSRPRARVAGHVFPLVSEASPVAVLINRMTASSAEAVAIAFQGRPHTRTFGERTRGQTTSNDQFPLRDGAMLNLSVSSFVDRAGRSYPGGIAPDEPVAGSTAGAVQDAAQSWLLGQAACADLR